MLRIWGIIIYDADYERKIRLVDTNQVELALIYSEQDRYMHIYIYIYSDAHAWNCVLNVKRCVKFVGTLA